MYKRQTREAVHAAWAEQLRAKADVRAEGARALQWMQDNGRPGIVLAGRPYHVDPEINHGIPELIASYNLAVLTEDSLPQTLPPEHPLRVNDQWVYHSRLYRAAEFVRTRDDLELVQLNSFGCGLDAITADQVSEILEGSGKLYTLIKIDGSTAWARRAFASAASWRPWSSAGGASGRGRSCRRPITARSLPKKCLTRAIPFWPPR